MGISILAKVLLNILTDNAAMVIALCALTLTVYEMNHTRKHNRLSVKPHLATFASRKIDLKHQRGTYIVNLQNNGLGPSLITNFKILIDGKFANIKNLNEATKELKNLFQSQKLYKDSIVFLQPNHVISSNNQITLLDIQFPIESEEEFHNVEKKFINRIDFLIEYKSMYKQKFTFDSRKNS